MSNQFAMLPASPIARLLITSSKSYSARRLAIKSLIASLTIELLLPALPRKRSSHNHFRSMNNKSGMSLLRYLFKYLNKYFRTYCFH